ncbi:MAG: tellurite resistance TerB family protein, partial [Geminicoccaceae bacterium]
MLSQQAALIYAMVCAGSDREIAQEEIGIIGDLVDHLPIFCGIDRRQVSELAARCSERLAGPGGFDRV